MSVAARVRRPRAPPFIDPPGYARHRPEATLLCQFVEQHYPAFREPRATAALLADEVLRERPLRQWVLSLPQALRFLLATNPAALTQVLGVVYRTIARHLIGKTGLTRTLAATGAVTLIQRFGSALNLNIQQRIGAQVGQVLERRGLIERDIENAWLASDVEAAPAAGAGRRCERRGPRGRVLAARRGGHRSERAREARAAVPLRQSPARGQ